MKINEFFFSEVLDTLEIGHVVGGTISSTGGISCSCGNGRDVDGSNGDFDMEPPIEQPQNQP